MGIFKRLRKQIALISFLLMCVGFAMGTEWETVGQSGLSAGRVYYTSMALYNGTPYIAYADETIGNKITVMKFNGTSWELVGTKGFTSLSVSEIVLAFNGSIPYVLFYDNSYDKLTLMRFNGTDWETVGASGFTEGSASSLSLVFYNGIPYVAFRDNAHEGKATVMKFNGSSWQTLGSAGFTPGTTDYVSFVINNGTPYVAFTDGANSNKASVMKFNGTTWITVGTAGFSANQTWDVKIAFDNNIPYVAYRQYFTSGTYQYRATVMKFNGTFWENVGDPGFSTGWPNAPCLEISNGIPYVFYGDNANSGKATLMKFNGTAWEAVGTAGFSTGQADYNSLVFYNNVPFVSFIDGANSYKATVMRYGDPGGGTTNPASSAFSYLFTRNSAEDVRFDSQKNSQSFASLQINETLLGTGVLSEADFTNIVFMQDLAAGKPYINVPETNPIAIAVNNDNTNLKVVTASFTGLPKQKTGRVPPIIMNGVQISDSKGNVFPAYTGYVRNISWDNVTGTLTFGITHFTEYGVPVLIGKTFAGTAANAALNTNGTNISVAYTGGSITGTADHDRTVTVKKISGLSYETVLSDVPATVNNLYRPLVPGVTYNISFEYINRGNATDQIDLATSITRANAGHFTVDGNQSKNVAPWQVASFNVEIDADNALAYERATVDVTIDINGETPVSYNGFSDAYQGGTFASDGRYGGADNLSHRFVLEAQGYDLTILSRGVTVNAPAGYTGVPVSETNLVPGATIKYSIAVRNNNYAVATSINITDVIPNACHLYYTDLPSVEGAQGWAWKGATDNMATIATNEAVKFEITIPARATVTASYTVTLD